LKPLSEIDKTRLLQELRERVARDLDALIRRHQDIQAGATHEENRAEHAKDTRATEQSYLARGLAGRVDGMRRIANQLETTSPRSFDPTEPIAVMAIVELREEADERDQIWWLVPGPAGIVLTCDAGPIQTVTPAAPFGRALLGLSVGDEGSHASPSGERSFEILQIA
jgi:transcription elongation GreA/GreB family factor